MLATCALIAMAAGAVWFVFERDKPADWGVMGTQGDRAVVVGIPGVFGICDHVNASVTDENDDQIGISVRVDRGICSSKVGHFFAPVAVRLDAPINGRRIVGSHKIQLAAGSASVPSSVAPSVPDLRGLTREDAVAALAAIGVVDVSVKGTGSTVRSQRPRAGAAAVSADDERTIAVLQLSGN